MAVRLDDLLLERMGELRTAPTPFRIRGFVGAEPLVPLEPSRTTSWCADKGRATSWTAIVG